MSASDSTNCLGVTWMQFKAESKAFPDIRCYGITRSGLSINFADQTQGNALSLNDTGSLRSFGCVGSTTLFEGVASRSLIYKGLALEIHEMEVHSQSNEIAKDTEDDLDYEELGRPNLNLFDEVRKQAASHGYSSPLLFLTRRIFDRSVFILQRQGQFL